MGLFQRIRGLVALRLRERHTAAALRSTPLRSIKAALNHYPVKVSGRLRVVGDPLVSPLTGRSCAWYSVTLERTGELLVLEEDGCDFLLDDGTAVAYVSAGASSTRVLLDKDSTLWGTPFVDLPQDHAAFVRWHGYTSSDVGIDAVFREGVLQEGERVSVCGLGAWEVNPDPGAWSIGYRDFPRRLHLRPLSDGALYVSDVPALIG